MRFKSLFILLIAGYSSISYCQEKDLAVSNIPFKLLLNANSVVRNEELIIDIEDVDELVIQNKIVVTVLNSNGDNSVKPGQFYDDNLKIKKQYVIVYDADGKEIKDYKQRDFKDVSGVDRNTLFSDNRISYLDYTPTQYPYTIEYYCETKSGSTAFLRSWMPVKRYSQSVEESTYTLNNPESISLRVIKNNLNDSIINSGDQFNLKFKAENISAYKYESLSPSLETYAPIVKVALDHFSLIGVEGEADNWKDYGKWQYDHLLKGRNILPAKTIQDLDNLTKGVTDTLEKAKLIYEYAQNKTRYISIQLGIGGWMPMLASEVDNLGYGDCKALTNYTKSLLESQGIKSNYAIVYSGDEGKSIDKNIVSLQGDHVILNVPQKGEDVWLECTSQTHPFNYLGDFTDNRDVLLVKPNGGEIVSTKKYHTSENLVHTVTNLKLDKDRNFRAVGKRSSQGIEYGNIYPIEKIEKKRQSTYYKNLLGHINYLDLEHFECHNNKDAQTFEETLTFSGANYGTNAGSRILVPLSIFNIEGEEAPRYKPRTLDLEILRGKTVIDELTIELPENYIIEILPKATEIKNQFGSYSFQVVSVADNKLKVTRKYVLKDGLWKKEEYTAFREYMNKVNLLNNQKAVIAVPNQ